MQTSDSMQETPTIETNTSPTEPTSVTDIHPWRALLKPWWQATLAILPTFLMTRLIFVLLTYFGGVLFFVPNYWLGKLGAYDVLHVWYQWDAIRFITIATQGYQTPEYAAFFPLFPALIHALDTVSHIGILASGMLLSNLALFGTLIVLYRLVETEFDKQTARRTALYLSIFPTALFFFAAYNESLFLFFMLLCFYTMRRGSWWLAGIFGGLATLTRSLGVLLAVIFLYEYIRQTQRNQQRPQVLRLLSNLLAALLIPLGLGIYAFGLGQRFGDPLAFSHAQTRWHPSLSLPWQAPLDGIKILLTQSPFTFTSPHLVIELTALSLFLALLLLCFFGPDRFARHQWSFLLFGLLALVFALIFPGAPNPNPGAPYDTMPSMQRYVLEIFPGFIMLARLGRHPWFHQAYLLLALPMLTFLTLQFMTGHWTI